MPSIYRSLLSPAMVKNSFLAILHLLALPQETKAPQQLWIAQASPEHRPEAAVMMSFLFCFILKCADVAHPALLHLLREWTEEPKSSKNIKVRISVILPATPVTAPPPFALGSPFPDSSCCQPKPEELPDYHLCWDVDWTSDFPFTQAIRRLP